VGPRADLKNLLLLLRIEPRLLGRPSRSLVAIATELAMGLVSMCGLSTER
jgi:hypothetical protein